MGFISLHFSVSLKAAAVNLKHTCTHLERKTHSSLFQDTKTKLRTKDWTAAPLFEVQSEHKRALKGSIGAPLSLHTPSLESVRVLDARIGIKYRHRAEKNNHRYAKREDAHEGGRTETSSDLPPRKSAGPAKVILAVKKPWKLSAEVYHWCNYMVFICK